ncbi:MAG TPA: RNA polymerase sigma factor [Steroidobacteraceae bacterium]|nr:RNA polymerase sigma factor [Steroidobacteraceae bacterium]
MQFSDRKSFVATMAARYGRRLRQFLSVRLRNVHDAPDVAQEVFLRLLRVERQDTIRNPEAYLFTVASHVLQQHALRRAADPVFVDITDAYSELALPEGEDPAVKADRAGRMEALERAIQQLPPKVGAALVLHRVAGHTVQEIADQLGTSRDSVKKYLMRAAEHCRKGRAARAASE